MTMTTTTTTTTTTSTMVVFVAKHFVSIFENQDCQ
jgi:hypothetical protein